MRRIESQEQVRAVMGALAIHLGLAALLLVSFNWSEKPPSPVQAELWSALPAVLAPPPEPVVAPPKPRPQPPDPPKPPERSQADISLEKKKQEEAKRAEALKEAQRQEALKKAAERREAERKAAEKRLADQRLRERQAAERAAQQRQEELARLGLDANAKPKAEGRDATTKAGLPDGAELGALSGALADYAALIRARVLTRIRFDPAAAPGNPEVIFMVEQLPSGEITGVRKQKSSGVLAWDNAVERAIYASSPLPKKKDGSVERRLELRFRPLEER